MLKLLPSILALLVAVSTAVAPFLQGAIAKHPAIATAIASVYAILSHFLPSPVKK